MSSNVYTHAPATAADLHAKGIQTRCGLRAVPPDDTVLALDSLASELTTCASCWGLLPKLRFRATEISPEPIGDGVPGMAVMEKLYTVEASSVPEVRELIDGGAVQPNSIQALSHAARFITVELDEA